ncbi:MAG: hypothetical protein U1E45_12840 [Geminicoccaceae bacterium]
MTTIRINRAPVLTLWATIVAGRLGFDHEEALTLGRAVAGITAASKGARLGIFTPSPEGVRERREKAAEGEEIVVDLLGRAVPTVVTPDGLRATSKGAAIAPASVQKYLASKFGAALPEFEAAMARLALSLPPAELARRGFQLYVAFRPTVPEDASGWGADGELDSERIEKLAAPG